MTVQLDGKIAVVLGASAENGSGGAIARALRAANCEVVIAARREKMLREFAARIGATAIVCDARDEQQVAALADRTRAMFGRIDIAVNAVGAPTRASVAEATRAQLLEALEVNYFAHVWFIRHMARAIEREGSIIVISSISGTCVTDGTVFPYSCAKAAPTAWSSALRSSTVRAGSG